MTTRYNLIINSHWIVADNNRLSFWYAVINADCHLLKTIYRQRGYKSLLVQTARWVFVTQNTILYACGGRSGLLLDSLPRHM